MKTASFTSFARTHGAVLALALFGIVLHLVYINGLGFHRDELLYFSLGQHPALGYHSTPPMIGLLSWMLSQTLGFTLIAARIIPALLFGALIWLSSAIAGELGGGKFARILTALSILCNLTFLR